MNQFEVISAWLESTYNIHVLSEWLSACLEWIEQESQGSGLSVEQLKSKVFEQWLLSDLAEISEPTLPEDLLGVEKTQLVSTYPLQLLSVLDVGTSLYGQKQKLEGKENPNEKVSADTPFQPAWEPKPSRMLLMELTDGHITVQAMEHNPTRCLHTQLPRGTKILVTGPLLCRNQMLLLSEHNVHLLGGEVDALMENYSPLAILEEAMEKNRQEEAGDMISKFSGAFITRAVDTKGKCSQSFHSSSSSKKMKLERFSQSGSGSFKTSPTTSHLKNRFVKKEEEGPSSAVKEEFDAEWEDDFDYAALLEEDDMKVDGDFEQEEHSTALHTNHNSHTMRPFQLNADRRNVGHRTHKQFSPPSHDSQRGFNVELSNKTLAGKPEVPNECDFFDDDLDMFDLDDEDIPMTMNSHFSKQPSFKAENKRNSLNNSKATAHAATSCATSVANTQKSNAASDAQNSPKPFQSKNVLRSKVIDLTEESSEHPSSTTSSPLSQLHNVHSHTLNTSPLCQKQHLSVSQNKTKTSPLLKNPVVITVPDNSFANKGSTQSSNQKSLSQTSILNKPSNRLEGRNVKQSKLSCFLTSKSVKRGNETPSTQISSDCKKDKKDIETSLFPNTAEGKSMNSVCRLSDRATSSTTGGSVSLPMEIDSIKMEVISEVGDGGEELTAVKGLPQAVIRPFPDTKKNVRPERTPFRYLDEIRSMKPPFYIVVKAFISTLTEKLKNGGGKGWSLSCRINDGTAALDVTLDNSVLMELIGFSAEDSVVMCQRKDDEQVKEIMKEGLTQCQQKLINTSCLMEIHFTAKEAKPVVASFIPVSAEHVAMLREKIQTEQAGFDV